MIGDDEALIGETGGGQRKHWVSVCNRQRQPRQPFLPDVHARYCLIPCVFVILPPLLLPLLFGIHLANIVIAIFFAFFSPPPPHHSSPSRHLLPPSSPPLASWNLYDEEFDKGEYRFYATTFDPNTSVGRFTVTVYADQPIQLSTF